MKLLNHEDATSLCLINFNDERCLAIGTTIINDEDETPKCGRIILYQYKNQQLQFLAEKEITGPPHGMVDYHGKLIVAVGNTVDIFV